MIVLLFSDSNGNDDSGSNNNSSNRSGNDISSSGGDSNSHSGNISNHSSNSSSSRRSRSRSRSSRSTSGPKLNCVGLSISKFFEKSTKRCGIVVFEIRAFQQYAVCLVWTMSH